MEWEGERGDRVIIKRARRGISHKLLITKNIIFLCGNKWHWDRLTDTVIKSVDEAILSARMKIISFDSSSLSPASVVVVVVAAAAAGGSTSDLFLDPVIEARIDPDTLSMAGASRGEATAAGAVASEATVFGGGGTGGGRAAEPPSSSHEGVSPSMFLKIFYCH